MIKVYVVYDNPKKQEQIIVEILQIEKKPRPTGNDVGWIGQYCKPILQLTLTGGTMSKKFEVRADVNMTLDFVIECDDESEARAKVKSILRYYMEQPPKKWTFEQPELKTWTEAQCQGKVLNLFFLRNTTGVNP